VARENAFGLLGVIVLDSNVSRELSWTIGISRTLFLAEDLRES